MMAGYTIILLEKWDRLRRNKNETRKGIIELLWYNDWTIQKRLG